MRKHASGSSLPFPASSSASSFSSSFSSSSASPASSAPPFPSSPRLADAKDPQHARRVALRQAAAADCGEHSARMQPERRSRSGRKERRRGRKGEREKAKRQVERQAILRLLPRVGGHAQSRGKKKGLALHRHLLRQRHAEKEAAKRPKRRLAVWRSRPASWLLSAASQEVASDTRELVYVSISGEIVPKPRCFQVAREETRFLKAQGITDRPDCSSAIWHPERLPVYRHLRETAFGPATEARRSPSLPETRQSSRVSTFAADVPVSSSDSPCSAATCSFAYWCLPPSLIKALANRGIHSLYPWQAECLSLALPCFARPDARSSNASSPSLPFPASSSSSPSASGSAAAASPSPASAFPGSSSSPSSVASSVELLIDPGDKKRGRDAGEETGGGAHEAQPGPDEAGKRRRRESCQNEEERGGSQASRLAGRGVDEDEGDDENASCPSSPSTAETIVADDEERESADGELAAEGDSKGKCSNEEARDREEGEKHAAKDGDDEDEDDEDGDDEDGDDGDGDDGDGDDAEDRDRKFNFLKRRKATPTEGSLTGRSLVYCAPTSGGKSLVADLIMVLRCLFAGKRCMYIVPHVSLCREKSEFLHNILFPTLCLRVQAFNASAGEQRKRTSSTVEKSTEVEGHRIGFATVRNVDSVSRGMGVSSTPRALCRFSRISFPTRLLPVSLRVLHCLFTTSLSFSQPLFLVRASSFSSLPGETASRKLLRSDSPAVADPRLSRLFSTFELRVSLFWRVPSALVDSLCVSMVRGHRHRRLHSRASE
ncbi:DEAD/DEAH box helicase domain-containing protein [Toxoplasma gondii RUB]|uniref:DEAD/DEAH box helicase domain-containing protein n=1 Tax=Toxoplasma gondii RUB TaxID=935652 RepID=A0A086M3T1_TOXGO|nr:DEAD/DEAH box helicase domain-containing protein [Toxoplasma gondii RUB]